MTSNTNLNNCLVFQQALSTGYPKRKSLQKIGKISFLSLLQSPIPSLIRPMKNLLLIFLFLCCFSSGFAQSKDFLLLKRGNNTKSQIRYHTGDQITYKSAKLGYYVTDAIKEFSTDYIYLSENIISPNDIIEIDIRNKDPRNNTLKNLNSLFLGAGLLLLTVESVNSIYQRNELSIDKGVGLTSALLTGLGIGMLPLRYKVFRNQGRNRLQIILMRMDE